MFIEQNIGKPLDAGLLDRVNSFTNRSIRYTVDRKVFGRDDYWASPSQVIGARGDCEDYVTSKFFILSKLGVRDRDMKVIVVRDLVRGVGHAVLAVRADDRIMILDNQSSRVRDHRNVFRYQPLYSMNTQHAWLNLAVRRVSKPSPLTRKHSAEEQDPLVRLANLQDAIADHLAKGKLLRLARAMAGSTPK